MTDTNAKLEVKPAHVPRRWGLDGDRVLEKLQSKLVLIRLADGTSIAGQLVGYNEYTMTLRCTDGVKLLSKGFAVVVEPSKGNSQGVLAPAPASSPG